MAELQLTFAQCLKLFSEATANSMKYAEICAMMALRHFADHGNLTYCQQFMDAMPKNYIRKTAFLKWLANFAPITMEKDKLLKDTSENAVAFDLDGAEKTRFWEFAPDMEAIAFGPNDVINAIKAVIKKFENPKRSTPENDLASAAVVNLKNYVETKVNKAPGNLPDQGLDPAAGDRIGEQDADADAGLERLAELADLAATNEGMAESLTINDLGGDQAEATA